MDVSIIIPIYNTDLYKLKRCIFSVAKLIKTSNKQIECILVDDGSDDFIEKNIKQIIRKAGLYQNRFVYFKKQNGGAGSARNYGLTFAKGDYILFVDADDVVIPQKTAEMLKYGDKKQFDILLSDLLYKKKDKKSVWKVFPHGVQRENINLDIKDILFVLSKSEKINGPVCKLIRTEFLREYNCCFPENMILGEDAVFLFSLLRHSPKLLYYNCPTYVYNFEDSSLINKLIKHSDHVIDDSIHMYEDYMQLLSTSEIDKSLKKGCSQNRTDMYINCLFNLKLELGIYNVLSDRIEKKLIYAVKKTDKYCNGGAGDLKNSFRKWFIVRNNKVLCKALVALKKTIRKIKYL